MLILQTAVAADSTAADDPALAAVVNGQLILTADVERALVAVVRGRLVDPASLTELRQEVLERLIERCLVLQHVADSGLSASQAEIDREVQRLQKGATQRGIAWDEFLRQAGRSELELRQTLAWRIGWTRFLETHLTDGNLQRYFAQHRRHFDGSRIRVAHLLLPHPAERNAAATAEGVERAQQIRQQIQSGQLTFENAASRFSEAPTAANGGEIGFILRTGPMPEPFAAAAFALDPGQVSEPVISPFGVHLIKCLEIEPGTKTWQEVRSELVQAVTRHLFRWAADRARGKATVERPKEGMGEASGAEPHQTGALAEEPGNER